MMHPLRATFAATLLLLPLTAVASITSATAAPAAGPRTLTYTILMGDDPIGSEEVRVEPQGDRSKVTITASTRVKVLFINFRYDHKREELWKGSSLESLKATTDDDGTPHTLELTAKPGGFTLVADGKPTDLPATALPLSLWTAEVLMRSPLFSVIDGARYTTTVKALGSETIEAGGRKVEAQHHRIDGDVERDLWYAADGTLLKTRFKRSGYDITYVLK
ncbi:DUF6134 family protein [Azospirillum griseum]|uniref:DUF3108 domain-containing protein n=1 Tax=Azospirillum griseum TaxID=2496639 RepID=A0A3S0IG36_9PROT|nr:DUF6134 family protein [Azospirillum griseum]RTR21480.1 DUF3108 domain-containing protein [Azospirillum griseum]